MGGAVVRRMLQRVSRHFQEMTLYGIVNVFNVIWWPLGLYVYDVERRGGALEVAPARLGPGRRLHVACMVALVAACVALVAHRHASSARTTSEWLVLAADGLLVAAALGTLLHYISVRERMTRLLQSYGAVDARLLQLRVRFSYGRIYQGGCCSYVPFLALLTCHELLRYLLWCKHAPMCAPYALAVTYSLAVLASWVALVTGVLLTQSYHIHLINEHVQQEVDAAGELEEQAGSGRRRSLYPRRAPRFQLEVVAWLLQRLCDAHRDFTSCNSLSYLIIIEICICCLAVISFCYLSKGVVYMHVVIYSIEGLLFVVQLVCQMHFFQTQCKRTVRLMGEWHVAYTDPALVAHRNTLILQAMHSLHEQRAGGALPLKCSTIIKALHGVLLLVTLLMQTINMLEGSATQ